jgi:uncharacterized protein (TIGR00288 family)
LAEHESSLAVLVDFENMARPGAKGRADFDIHLVLNRLAEKGRVIVKRAYADWSRYRDARHELMNAGLGLIEMPSAREGAKNRADIQMAVDAMELAYSREHVNTFVIVSGDSDFTPLVGKLRELNKRVIGVGNRESASELLIANCDEFIFYDRLAAEAAGGSTARRSQGSGLNLNPVQLLQETLTALQREGVEWPLASIVKDSMRRKYPAFDESEHGFSTFSKFLEEAGGTGMVRLETDPRSGTYRVELAEGRTAAIPPMPTAAAGTAERTERSERSGEEGDGRRRRRRGGRRSEQATPAAGSASDESLAPDAEVFEVVVTPTPDLDLGTLPPLDEPISYEDMIMLGPEVDGELPDLVEASDIAPGEPPARSTRRRRRRGAGTDPEPTIADLEPVEADDAPEGDAEPAPAVAEEPSADDEGAGRKPRRRRRISAADAALDAPLPVIEEPAADEPVAEEAAVEEPVAEEPAPAGRRRVRRRSTTATPEAEAPEAPADAVAEEPEAEEAPKPKRRTRKKAADVAEPAAEAEPVAEVAEPEAEAPAPRRRRTRAAAAATEEAPAAEVTEEAPKPARRTRKKAAPAAEAETAAEPASPEAEEAPKPKRRTRKKAAEPSEEPAS